ncbi:MAG TPA: ATP-binding protein [Moheibacter sp.]|nr:ATP-binding protein [Moheibacter sp.]
MNFSDRWINSILLAILGGLLIWIFSWVASVVMYNVPYQNWISETFFWKGILMTFFLPALVIMGLMALAFNSFSKHNITHLYNLVPDLNSEKTAKNIEALSEQISSLSDVKTKEIDILTERENYRREFLGNVSHEMKTPLFSIQGFLHTLIDGGLEDENIRDKYMDRIDKSVERLIFIIKDLDMITKLEAGELKLEMKRFDILAKSREIMELLEIKASKYGMTMKIDKTVEEEIFVIGDIERIEQVLVNLIVNAIHYSAKPQATLRLQFEVLEEDVLVKVKDNGMGMQPEQLNRIFERFYRVDKSRSRNYGGSGLGLSIVKHILEAHEQKIMVESEYGEGTTFSFYLQKA